MRFLLSLFFVCFLIGCEKPKDRGIFGHQSFTLSNGLDVYVVENKFTPLINVHVFYKVGTADDSSAERGLSHFLEHLMFKGTEKFPKNSLDQILSRQGADFNAYTTQDFTAYTSTASADQLELILLLEADRMSSLTFSKDSVEKEKQVVLEERAMRLENNPFGPAQEEFLRVLYGNHPYGIPPIGYVEHINAYSQESAMTHYKKYYTPQNAFILVTGNASLEKVKTLVEKYFQSIPGGEKITRQRLTERPSSSNITIRNKSPRIQLTYVHMSYHAPNFKSEGHEHALPIKILSHIIAGNELSRFYEKFVEGEKIAADVDSEYNYTSFDPQDFSFGMTLISGISPDESIKKMRTEIQNLLSSGITEQELNQAKRDLTASFAFVLDGVNQPAKYFASIANGYSVENIEHLDKKINQVTLEQVNAAVRYLLSSDPAVTLILLPNR